MRAIRIETPGSFELVDVPEPVPGRGEVVVAVRACGICGTDLHILAGEFPPTPYPIIPGHEAAGVVAAVGSGVTGLREGDRIAIDPSLFCGACEYCRVNRGNLCSAWGAVGDTVDGAFAEFVAVPAANAYPIPDSMSFGSAAVVEPVSCAVHALDRLGTVFGLQILIIGGGTMGLILAQLLDHAGAASVGLVDLRPDRVERARGFGFEAATSVGELRGGSGRGFDVAIEASGAVEAVSEALAAVRRGGTVMIFGVAPAGATVAVEPFRIYNEEITVVGSMAVLASYGRAVEVVAAGVVDADRMVTGVFPIERFGDALEEVRSGTGIKTQIDPTL